jgi:hypothetical protein
MRLWKVRRLVSPGVRGIEVVRDRPGRARRWWIQRRHGRWNLRLPGVAFKTAQFPRFWLVSRPLTVAWWPKDTPHLEIRIGPWRLS